MPRDTPDLAAAASHLQDDHVAFARRLDELCWLAHRGAWPRLDGLWEDFVHDLKAHLELEERQLFPRLAEQGRENLVLVDKLGVDHVLIRGLLADIGLQIQRRAIVASTTDGFIALMRKHATFEDERIRQWAQHEDTGARSPGLTRRVSLRSLAGSSDRDSTPGRMTMVRGARQPQRQDGLVHAMGLAG